MNNVPYKILITCQPNHKTSADLSLFFIFKEDRPPKGPAGIADWHLNGFISKLIKYGHFKANEGEIALIATNGKIPQHGVILLGIGEIQKFKTHTIQTYIGKIINIMYNLKCKSININPFFSGHVSIELSSVAIISAFYQYLTKKPNFKMNTTENNLLTFRIALHNTETLKSVMNYISQQKHTDILQYIKTMEYSEEDTYVRAF